MLRGVFLYYHELNVLRVGHPLEVPGHGDADVKFIRVSAMLQALGLFTVTATLTVTYLYPHSCVAAGKVAGLQKVVRAVSYKIAYEAGATPLHGDELYDNTR